MVSVKLVVINNSKVVEDQGVVLVPTADRLEILHSRTPRGLAFQRENIATSLVGSTA